MAVTLGSNIASLRATRQLDKVSSAVGGVFERLSSGQRINGASDDPAGLSVSIGLGVKSRVLNRAAQNLGDATSLVTIADSALGEIGGILTRLAELAQQAANGSFSDAQRRTLSAEYNSLDKEIRRIGASAEFNGLNLLQGGTTARAGRVVAAADPLADTGVMLATSSDGRYVAYYEGDSGSSDYSAYVVDTVTGERKQYFSQPNGVTSLLQNGDVIFGAGMEVYYFSYSTGQSRTLFINSGNDTNSFISRSVSADGRYVNFISNDTFTGGSTVGQALGQGARLWQFDITSGAIREVADLTGVPLTSGTATSSDGRYYAFQNSSTSSVQIIDTFASSNNIRSYTSAASGISVIGISTTGEALFHNGINLSRTSGTSSVTQLTSFTAANSIAGAVASADGTFISFRTNRSLLGTNTSGAQQVYTLDLTTGNLSMRTNFASNSVGANNGLLSADGSRSTRYSATLGGLVSFDTSAGDSTFDFEAGFGAAGNIIAAYSSFSSALRGLGGGVLSSQFGARLTLDRVRENLENLSQLRGTIGAAQSRLAIGTSLAKVQADELISANARVRDADIASEAGELTRLSILQQAGSALLAQANQQPALALRLLA